jgi:D-beta-D-heptose 7-phosphate kinase / D-beta-D-heptose 1-phosphate adenosyltransferase
MNISDQFLNAKVLVVGDILYDQYLFGEVKRISPEAPVPIVKFEKEEILLGGAANVASNIIGLGAQTMLIGFLGDDINGKVIQKKLNKDKIINKLIFLKNQSTIVKQRIVSQQQHLVRIDFDNGYKYESSDSIFNLLNDYLSEYNVLILSDYGKGTLHDIQKMISLASSLGKKTIVDPKGSNFSKYKNASILTPNFSEFENVVGKCNSEDEVISKAKALCVDLCLGALLLTRGEKGMTYVSSEKNEINLDAISRDVFDVTGAGDTVIATLAASVSSGFTIEDALNFANLAAGAVVENFGTYSVSIQDLVKKNEINKNSFSNKKINIENLSEKIKVLKKNKNKIIMTNGCFDILHMGHIRYLKEAKSLGDILVVALNSDVSIKNIKGYKRPINNQLSRLEVLSAIECVDIITVFNDDTPIEVIKIVNPDILVKAGDYNPEEIIGGDFVKKNNGEVKILTYYEGYSTSNSINKIKEDF